ncbi:hypothetical protein LOZ58_006805 [Ophidiomyces ophidiicola]|nr:hypothetical protein LOZ58_006805 [Ophidiomyces ophidiicola]
MALTLNNDATERLQELGKWFKTANITLEKENVWRCVDPDRFEKWKPFLNCLGLYKEGNGFTLWRVSGNVTIGPDRGYYGLFFPISGAADISNYHVNPGEYIQFTEPQLISANLDFLTALVQEKSPSE